MGSAYIDLCLALVNQTIEAETCYLRTRLEDRENELEALQEQQKSEEEDSLRYVLGSRLGLSREKTEGRTLSSLVDEMWERLQDRREVYPQMSARIEELEQHIDRLQKEAHREQSVYDDLLRRYNHECRARKETQLEIDCAATALRSALGHYPNEVSLPGTLMDLIRKAEQRMRERENAYDRLLALVGSTREPVGRPLLMSELLDLVEGKIQRGGGS